MCMTLNKFKSIVEECILHDWSGLWNGVEKYLSDITSNCEDYIHRLKENTVNMTTFLILYDDYTDNAKYESVYSHVKERDGFVDDAARKRYARTMDKVIEHRKDNLESIMSKEKIQQHIKRMKDSEYTIAEYQKVNEDILEMMSTGSSIIYKLTDGKFCDGHNYSNAKAEEDIKGFNKYYEYIANYNMTYFEKCVQYYQLELKCCVEGVYNLFRAAKIAKRKGEMIKEDTYLFRMLYVFPQCDARVFLLPYIESEYPIVNYKTPLENKLIANMKIYADIYAENPEELRKVIQINRYLNMMVRLTMYRLKNTTEISISKVEYTGDEEFFKDFLGNGQHITLNKDFDNDVSMSRYRKFFHEFGDKDRAIYNEIFYNSSCIN